jgi:hypothetical protein
VALSILPLVVAAEAVFIRAPGHDDENNLMPGEQSLLVIVDGAGSLLSSALVSLVLLPALAVGLYWQGYRVAGPLVGVFSVGMFLARTMGAPM